MDKERKRKFFSGLSKISRGLLGSGRATEQNLLEKLREILIERAPFALEAFDSLKGELSQIIIPHAPKEIQPPEGIYFVSFAVGWK